MFEALFTNIKVSRSDVRWYMDTGATEHMMIQEYEKFEEPIPVKLRQMIYNHL